VINEFIELICRICQKPKKGFENFFRLKQHFRTKHPEEKTDFVSCCGKGFHRRHLLVDHIYCHINPAMYSCETCGKVLVSRKGLETHYKNAHSSPKSSEVCPFCGLLFVNHKKHMTTHVADDKEYQCYICHIMKKNFSTLKVHMLKQHTPQNGWPKS
jgi:KRAB domain-containing zinc finger protein